MRQARRPVLLCQQHAEEGFGGAVEFLLAAVHDAHGTRQAGRIQFHGHQAALFDLRLHGARGQNADSLPQRDGFLDHLNVVEVHGEVDLDALRAEEAVQFAADAQVFIEADEGVAVEVRRDRLRARAANG